MNTMPVNNDLPSINFEGLQHAQQSSHLLHAYEETQNRPVGVSIIAGLQFLGAGLSVLAAVLLGSDQGTLPPVVWLILAGISVALGVGLWTLKPWARRVAIGLYVVNIMVGVGSLGSSFGSSVLQIAVACIIIAYLRRPSVGEAFQ